MEKTILKLKTKWGAKYKFVLNNEGEIEEIKTLYKNKWRNLETCRLGFYLNPETSKLDFIGWEGAATFMLDDKKVSELYPAIVKERNINLVETEDRLERYKIMKKYSDIIMRLELYYIKKDERCEEVLPAKILRIIETTPRTEIENFLVSHPERKETVDDYDGNGYFVFFNSDDEDWDISFCCRKCSLPFGLDDDIIEVQIDSYSFPSPLSLRYHKACTKENLKIGESF